MRRWAMGLFLAFSLMLNVLTLTVSSVAFTLSSLFEAVTGLGTVVGMAGDALADARSKQRLAEAELEGANKEKQRLAGEISDLNANKAALSKENADLSRKNVDLSKKNTSLLDDVAELRTERVVKYRGNDRLIRDAVGDTAQRISRRTAVSASRALASMFGEAVPVVGTAVIVGSTALDLNDACQIMKDLHALEVAFNPEKALGPEATEVCGMRVPTEDEVWQAVQQAPGQVWERTRAVIPNVPEIDVTGWTDWASRLPLPWQ